MKKKKELSEKDAKAAVFAHLINNGVRVNLGKNKEMKHKTGIALEALLYMESSK
jgi:hypothetical protein